MRAVIHDAARRRHCQSTHKIPQNQFDGTLYLTDFVAPAFLFTLSPEGKRALLALGGPSKGRMRENYCSRGGSGAPTCS